MHKLIYVNHARWENPLHVRTYKVTSGGLTKVAYVATCVYKETEQQDLYYCLYTGIYVHTQMFVRILIIHFIRICFYSS